MKRAHRFKPMGPILWISFLPRASLARQTRPCWVRTDRGVRGLRYTVLSKSRKLFIIGREIFNLGSSVRGFPVFTPLTGQPVGDDTLV